MHDVTRTKDEVARAKLLPADDHAAFKDDHMMFALVGMGWLLIAGRELEKQVRLIVVSVEDLHLCASAER